MKLLYITYSVMVTITFERRLIFCSSAYLKTGKLWIGGNFINCHNFFVLNSVLLTQPRKLKWRKLHFLIYHCTMSVKFLFYLPISRPIRRTVKFSLELSEKNYDECILILVIYWKKIGLIHTKISNHNIIYSS